MDSRAVSFTTDEVDYAQFFNRQHYIDFLGREPDTSGLIFWDDAIISRNSGPSWADLNSLAMRHDLIGFSAHSWNTESSASGVNLNLQGQNFYVASDKAGLNTIEFYSGDMSGNFATSAAGGAQDDGPMTAIFTSKPSAMMWQMGTGGDGFFARIDPVGTGTSLRYWLGNNSGGLSRCTANCTAGGATWSSRRGAWTGDQQSFVLPFELFHGDVNNPANDCGAAGATTGCGHLIAGTTRVWETVSGATDTNTWYVNSPANLTKASLGNRSYINQLTFEPSDQTAVVIGLPGKSAHIQGRIYNLNVSGLVKKKGLPKRYFPTTRKYGLSTAAGSYQIVYNQNWKELSRSLGFKDFSERNQAVAALELVRARDKPTSLPTVSGYNWNATPKANQPFGGTISGTGFVSGGSQVWFCLSGTSTCYQQPTTEVSVNSSTSLSVSNVNLSNGSWEIYVPVLQPQTPSLTLVEDTRFYIRAVADSGLRVDLTPDWFYRRLPRFEPTFVSQPSTSGSRSLLDLLQKLALLFQAIVLTIGSAFASAFGVVSYLRGKADLKLKQLQIREMEIKLENMERERDRALQEAKCSSIILLS
jgi:hypothetical protein